MNRQTDNFGFLSFSLKRFRLQYRKFSTICDKKATSWVKLVSEVNFRQIETRLFFGKNFGNIPVKIFELARFVFLKRQL